MKFDNRTPCASCPYRRDAQLAFWSKEEFDNLQRQSRNEYAGSQFGCHEYNKQPAAEHRPCIGWLLQQKKDNVPSILLRMTLMSNPEALEQWKEISDDGLDLYETIEEMCEANYPGGRNRPRQGRKERKKGRSP